MKITDRNGIQDPRLGGATAVEPRGTGASDGAAEGSDDHLDVSETSRALARLFGLAQAAPTDDAGRSERLAKLSAAVENGTYAPDLEKTARKLLLDELA